MRFLTAFVILGGFSALMSCQTGNSRTTENVAFQDSLSKKTFGFFWELTNPDNGLVPDRWPTPSFSSIAATGFGLTSYLIGVERGYISREAAASRTLTTLRFFLKAPQGEQESGVTGHRGFFYHFLDMKTGMRFQRVELSTIDTGLLMAGVLSSQSYFDGTSDVEVQIRQAADSLYRQVEWDWAMNGGSTMSMGWHPESGFLASTWRGYNEAMILYVLALGSPTHPLDKGAWEAWTKTYQWSTWQGQPHVNFGPLFGHQYSHMYIDFRGIQDDYMKGRGIDYFENSRRATLANRQYCIYNPGGWSDYSELIWGLTACDGPGNQGNADPNISFMGYSARGAARGYIQDDGTIAPTAAGGSIPFAPEVCLPALEEMSKRYGDKLYSTYGFKDAFNPSVVYADGSRGWFDPDYLGIDQGPILMQLENYRTGLVWEIMKKNPYIVEGLRKAGFSGGWLTR
ncbi:MAG: Tat pathway signal protein [Cyclobacteriaceae bacterium]|nr:Tat pathway signal protein [Cyclobacteriaceae bacterium]